ncbi:50S ribosomal protein L24 [Candidatus Woesearchaeota archaeon B3_Woes]|nr:MAG: 50S ribosomal protein L24 [Candidatus Woesearchaeota archaeon B3_Woes]
MKKFSTKLKKSKQPRKQRRYQYNAPLHIRQKFVHVHLSKELREKHNKRNVGLKKGDSVKVLRGQFKGKTGKVDKIDLKKGKAIITGVELIKKDGSKVIYPITVSNLIITELDIEDKKRKKIFERKKND